MSSLLMKTSPNGSSHKMKPWPNWWLYRLRAGIHDIRPLALSRLPVSRAATQDDTDVLCLGPPLVPSRLVSNPLPLIEDPKPGGC
jgi:hypothetical protein